MRLWFRLWTGHILGALAIAMVFVGIYFGWRAARGVTSEEIWWGSGTMLLAFLLALTLGALAAYTFHDHHDRWYARNQQRVAETPLTAVGDVDITTQPVDTQTLNEVAHEAHSAREDGI